MTAAVAIHKLWCMSRKPMGIGCLETAPWCKISSHAEDEYYSHLLVCTPQAQKGRRERKGMPWMWWQG